MPRYRPGARARKGKNASLTCICAPIVAGYCPRTSTILDQGPIDTCNLEVQTSKLQSIHCGLPASWTRARRHPPSSPSPVASRGGGRALAFLNWTRVQLDRPLTRREASVMGVYAQRGRSVYRQQYARLIQHREHGPDPGRHVSHGIRQASSGRGASRSPARFLKGGSHPREPTHYRAPRAASRYLSHHIGFRCIIRRGSTS